MAHRIYIISWPTITCVISNRGVGFENTHSQQKKLDPVYQLEVTFFLLQYSTRRFLIKRIFLIWLWWWVVNCNHITNVTQTLAEIRPNVKNHMTVRKRISRPTRPDQSRLPSSIRLEVMVLQRRSWYFVECHIFIGFYEGHLSPLEAQVGQLGAQMGKLGAQMGQLEAQMGQLRAQMGQLREQMGQLKAQMG